MSQVPGGAGRDGKDAGTVNYQLHHGDCLAWLNSMPAGSVELVFGSPPYENCRLYLEDGQNMGIARDTEDWVAWMVEIFEASLRVCNGLVAFVVEGQTRDFSYSCGPALLIADLCRAGVTLRKPPIYKRIGIPGSGGPDWLRNDYEFVICATNGGKLPWSDNTACGHAPKWAPGGEMSHRQSNGARVNQWGHSVESGATVVAADGVVRSKGKRPSHLLTKTRTDKRIKDGARTGDDVQVYDPPAIANPGNVLDCIVGGGVMGGDEFCSQNEAPFPERLPDFFIRSFCPPGGTVLDPFAGSGTTLAVAVRCGRKALGCDLRASQVQLATKRLQAETPEGLFAE